MEDRTTLRCFEAISITFEDGNVTFPFELPEDGLALHSANVIDGVPELCFKASPKVPTIQEQDVAAIFRLVSENKRPEFFYVLFPPTHPMHDCRYFKKYSPAWLRWTEVGELLAEADWKMKCLNVGATSNDEKTSFRSWSAGSQLEGLATEVDFPEDGFGNIMMTCDYAKVQENEEEIVFPEEPKMMITDNNNSSYSKYITDIYQNVAYYDEPKFLKMQELIKLILAVEWLFREKGVRVNHQWMMKHTSKPAEHAKLDSRKKPPYDMIPKPTMVERPSSDVTTKTMEAELYDALKACHGVERHFGYFDFSSSQAIMFKENGTPCPPQKCLRICIEYCQAFRNVTTMKRKEWHILPFENHVEPTKDDILKLLPKDPQQEIASPMQVLKVEDFSTESRVQLKINNSIQPFPLFPFTMTIIMTASLGSSGDNSFVDEDPNMPILPAIPGVCEAVIPNVKSWDELIELSVPIPCVQQAPFLGFGEPTASGGVSTSNFAVRKEPMRERVVQEETERKENYIRRGDILGVQAAVNRTQGQIQLVGSQTPTFAKISEEFKKRWFKNLPSPPVSYIFAITNYSLEEKWKRYQQNLTVKTPEEYYHGTTLACNITVSQTLCRNGNCGICGITNSGLDPDYVRKNIYFQRFGSGFYLAPHSSKCHGYTKGFGSYRALLLCDVLPGHKYKLKTTDQSLTGPPAGYDSVYGLVGKDLNYPEIVVYKPEAVLPRYIILYQKDGIAPLIQQPD